jgi:thymidine phosphorylase
VSGYFFAVVGPSGAGKDSLMDGARLRLPKDQFVFAKRVVTRPPGQVGEDYESCPLEAFLQRQAQGEFLATWQAHGFHYGLKTSLRAQLEAGRHVLANCSRAALGALAGEVSSLVVLEVWAQPDVLAQRLKHRGRETAEQIALRLAREGQAIPAHLKRIRVSNNGALEDAIDDFTAAILSTVQASKPPTP